MDSKKAEIFRDTLRKFEREIHALNSRCSITEAQCHALLEINNNQGITLNDLASKLCLDKSSVSRTVENLNKLELVSREIPDNNRRTVKLNLTKKGKKTSQNINNENNTFFIDAFNDISNDSIDIFLDVFEKLTNNINKLNSLKLCTKK